MQADSSQQPQVDPQNEQSDSARTNQIDACLSLLTHWLQSTDEPPSVTAVYPTIIYEHVDVNVILVGQLWRSDFSDLPVGLCFTTNFHESDIAQIKSLASSGMDKYMWMDTGCNFYLQIAFLGVSKEKKDESSWERKVQGTNEVISIPYLRHSLYHYIPNNSPLTQRPRLFRAGRG